MKLNKDGIIELRKEVETRLSEVPDGVRIQLPTYLLERLLFQNVHLASGEIIKVPVWTGNFLRKLDLSQVSFTDAVLSYAFPVSEEEKSLIHYPSNFDFSHTNVKINFEEIVGKSLDSCDFSGVDLANSHGEVLEGIKSCNLSGTNIKLDFQNPHLMIYLVDLSKNSFSSVEVQARCFNRKSRYYQFRDTNFSDTGLSVRLTDNADERKAVSQLIRGGRLTGCFVNGKKIRNKEEKAAIKNRKREEYLVYKDELLQYVYDSIDEGMGRKLTPPKNKKIDTTQK